jgi:hypothetical protein
MSRLIFVLGNPGSGKSSSLRNLKGSEVAYITATGKELPFRTDIKANVASSMDDVQKMIVASKKPIVVIDDTNYLFTREVFGASEKTDKWDTYDKISKDFFKIVQSIITKGTDQNFYLFGHLEDPDSTMKALKTLGQATRKNNNPEGWTNIVLESAVDLGEFVFKVKTEGNGIKSPIDMFSEDTLPNDLKIVDKAINDYYKPSK